MRKVIIALTVLFLSTAVFEQYAFAEPDATTSASAQQPVRKERKQEVNPEDQAKQNVDKKVKKKAAKKVRKPKKKQKKTA